LANFNLRVKNYRELSPRIFVEPRRAHWHGTLSRALLRRISRLRLPSSCRKGQSRRAHHGQTVHRPPPAATLAEDAAEAACAAAELWRAPIRMIERCWPWRIPESPPENRRASRHVARSAGFSSSFNAVPNAAAATRGPVTCLVVARLSRAAMVTRPSFSHHSAGQGAKKAGRLEKRLWRSRFVSP